MVNPSPQSNPFTFGVNRGMKADLIRQYKLILKGNDVSKLVEQEMTEKEETFWKESEFSTKNLLMKIIGYSIGITLIILCVLIIEERSIPGIIFGSITIGFVGQYLYYDFRVIIEKKGEGKPGYNRLR
ncbi:MAG: hypothetical protein IPL46_35285 [Saprospiraceae bacterium]|nr:hypothetical protein [Saprospiraceae bacterium]